MIYGFSDGKLIRERILGIPAQPLAAGRQTHLPRGDASFHGVPYPADLAMVAGSTAGGSERLLVADNLSDDVLLMDAGSGIILHRFDLAENNDVPSTYPIAVAVTPAHPQAGAGRIRHVVYIIRENRTYDQIGAQASARMDFRHADRAPANTLNLILWHDAMGGVVPPAQLLQKHKRSKDEDD